MKNIWSFCIQRPVFTLVLTIAMLAFGALGYSRMAVDQYPKIEPPVVTITTILAGANPLVMDQDVTEIIEGEVGTLQGVDTISSTSSESRSQVTVTFTQDRDVDVAAQEVRDRVSAVRNRLPREIEPPLIEKIDPSAQAIIWLTFSGEGSFNELTRLVDNEIKDTLQSLPGVGGIQLAGFREEQVRVWLDAQRMEAYGVTAQDVVDALGRWQIEIPGGRIENELEESSVKIQGEFDSISQMNELIVKHKAGANVRLRDVAGVELSLADRRGIVRFNGKESIGVGVRKQSGGNTVAVAEAVKQALPDLKKRLPQWVDIQVAYDTSRFINATVEGVTLDVVFGAIITCVVIGLFLRSMRTTLISVLAIPTSLLATFFLLYAAGFTLNQMTLLGLSLAVGLVVDDAIVVIENIHRHIEEEGRSPREAAEVGTGEVAFSVLSATTSIVVIFLPVVFMGGIVGQFFGSFGATVALTIIISLIVSWTLTPMLAARFLKHAPEGPIAKLLAKPVDAVAWLYEKTYRAALRNFLTRVITSGVAVAVFVAGLGLAANVGKEFIPDADDSRFLVIFEMPVGTSIDATDAKVQLAEKAVFSHPEIRSTFMAIGLTGTPNGGLFFCTMSPPSERERSQREVVGELRRQFGQIPGFRAFISSVDPLRAGAIGSKSGDINYVLQGPDLTQLERISADIVARMAADPNFVDADADLRLSRPETRVIPNRDAAADLDVDVREISTALQIFLGGLDVAKFTDRGERLDVNVKGQAEQSTLSGVIGRISVKNDKNQLIRLSSVVDYHEDVGPNAINRYNRQRAVSITANVNGIPAGEGTDRFVKYAESVLASAPEYQLTPAGQSKQMAESMSYLGLALVMSILVVYLVLAAQFESFLHPFTVMMSLPLATTGVYAALFLTGSTLNVYSFIGIILLVGIVTRNSILLIDRMNQNRERGLSPLEAALEAGPVRLRPILMTSIAAMVGLIPVAIGHSEGGEARAPMGIAVIGGLFVSTLLTLYVIPSLYLLFDGVLDRGRRLVSRIRPPA